MKSCLVKTFLIDMTLLGVLCMIGLTVTPAPINSQAVTAPRDNLADKVEEGKTRRIYYKVTVMLPAHGNTFKPFNYVTWGYVRNPDGTLTFVNMNNGNQMTVSPPFTIQEQRAGKITR